MKTETLAFGFNLSKTGKGWTLSHSKGVPSKTNWYQSKREALEDIELWTRLGLKTSVVALREMNNRLFLDWLVSVFDSENAKKVLDSEADEEIKRLDEEIKRLDKEAKEYFGKCSSCQDEYGYTSYKGYKSVCVTCMQDILSTPYYY